MSEEYYHAGDKVDHILPSNYKSFQCGMCKKNVHCIAGTANGKPEVRLLKSRCNNDECECKCKIYYLGRDGKLKPYGTIDQSTSIDDFDDIQQRDPKTSNLIEALNAKFRELNKQNKVVKKVAK